MSLKWICCWAKSWKGVKSRKFWSLFTFLRRGGVWCRCESLNEWVEVKKSWWKKNSSSESVLTREKVLFRWNEVNSNILIIRICIKKLCKVLWYIKSYYAVSVILMNGGRSIIFRLYFCVRFFSFYVPSFQFWLLSLVLNLNIIKHSQIWIFSNVNIQKFKYAKIWTLSNLIILKFEHYQIWTLSNLNIIKFEHYQIWTLSNFNIIKFEHYQIWTFTNLNILKFEHSQIWTFSNLNILKFEHSQIWTFSNLNIIKFEHYQIWTF